MIPGNTPDTPPPPPPFTTKTYLSTREIATVTVGGAIVYSRRPFDISLPWPGIAGCVPCIRSRQSRTVLPMVLFASGLCPRVRVVEAYFFHVGMDVPRSFSRGLLNGC